MALPKNVRKTLTAREKRRLKWWKKKKLKSESETQKVKPVSPPQEHDTKEMISEKSTSGNAEKLHKQKKTSKKNYYIVFVGNLPFSATKEDILEHFQQLGHVTEVRLLTKKGTGESRGCAYVQFEDKATHMRALQMHHSELCGRKINVEFTSAGRKTDRRMAKLREKNLKAARFRIPPGTALQKTDNKQTSSG